MQGPAVGIVSGSVPQRHAPAGRALALCLGDLEVVVVGEGRSREQESWYLFVGLAEAWQIDAFLFWADPVRLHCFRVHCAWPGS